MSENKNKNIKFFITVLSSFALRAAVKQKNQDMAHFCVTKTKFYDVAVAKSTIT
jgi:hypothetical protein